MKKLVSKEDLERSPNEVARMARKVLRNRNSSRSEKIMAYTALNLLNELHTREKA